MYNYKIIIQFPKLKFSINIKTKDFFMIIYKLFKRLQIITLKDYAKIRKKEKFGNFQIKTTNKKNQIKM